MTHVSEKFVFLVFDRRYEEAKSLLSAERERLPKGAPHRLPDLSSLVQEKLGEIEDDASFRRVLAGLYRLADILMEQEYWADAELVLCAVIELSVKHDEPYLLTDSRFRRAICLKALGRTEDLKRAKSEIPKGTSIFIGDGTPRIEDI